MSVKADIDARHITNGIPHHVESFYNVYERFQSVTTKISAAGMGYSLNIYNQDAD